MRSIVIVLVASLVGAPEASAARAAAAAKSTAESHYIRGRLQHDNGEFEASIASLLRAKFLATETALRARIQLYLGLNHYVLGRKPEAMENFKQALRIDPTLVMDANKFKPSIVRAFSAARDDVIGVLRVEAVPPKTSVQVDDDQQRSAPLTQRLAVGPHTVILRHGRRRQRRRVVIRFDQVTRVVWRGRLPKPIVPTKVTRQPRPSDSAIKRPKRLWTWISAGSAVVTAAVGLGLALSANSDFDEYESLPDSEFDRIQELEDRIRKKDLAANILFGFAGALAISSAVLFWWEGRTPDRNARRLSWRPFVSASAGGLTLRTSF